MRAPRTLIACLTAIVPLTSSAAQHAILPPIRPLGPIIATAKEPLTVIFGARVLSDGRVIVNDPNASKVVLFDSTLAHTTVLVDSIGIAARRYPNKTGTVFRYTGDSTLFYDPSAMALLVLDPTGKIARIVSAPATYLSITVKVGVDPGGRIIYTGSMSPVPGLPAMKNGPPTQRSPDSLLVLRANLITRQIDTLTYVRSATTYPNARTIDSTGYTWNTPVMNPVPVFDGVTYLPDGTVAVVRAQDFHIDWIAPDGTRSASPKIPHEWVQLSDSAKAAIVDSARQQFLAHPIGRQTSTTNGVTRTRDIIAQVPPASELPDYQAPFNSVTADADGNLWIQEVTRPTPQSGPVYELVNRRGELFDRVQLPGSTSIVGFGPGVVYLSSRTGTGLSLVRARIR